MVSPLWVPCIKSRIRYFITYLWSLLSSVWVVSLSWTMLLAVDLFYEGSNFSSIFSPTITTRLSFFVCPKLEFAITVANSSMIIVFIWRYLPGEFLNIGFQRTYCYFINYPRRGGRLSNAAPSLPGRFGMPGKPGPRCNWRFDCPVHFLPAFYRLNKM